MLKKGKEKKISDPKENQDFSIIFKKGKFY